MENSYASVYMCTLRVLYKVYMFNDQDSVESATVSVSKRLVIESLLEIVRLKRRKQAFEWYSNIIQIHRFCNACIIIIKPSKNLTSPVGHASYEKKASPRQNILVPGCRAIANFAHWCLTLEQNLWYLLHCEKDHFLTVSSSFYLSMDKSTE